MKRIIILISLLLLPGISRAMDFDFKGWVEDNTSVTGTDYTPGDVRELRLILNTNLVTGLSFHGQLYGKLFLGYKTLYIDSVTLLQDTRNSELYLDRAYFSYKASNLKLRAGRQRLAWGTGFIFKPTDIFNEVNLIDPQYTRQGIDALELTYYPGGFSAITLLGTFDNNDFLSPDKYAVKGKTTVGSSDFSLSLVTSDTSKIELAGFDFAGSIGNIAGLRVEGLYDIEAELLDLSIGTDYRVNEYVYLYAEYFDSNINMNDAYLYTGIQNIVNELLTLSGGFLLGGPAALLSTSISYSLSNDTDLTASMNFYSGGTLNTHYLKIRFNF